MEKSTEQIVRPLTAKYAVALGLLAALAATNFFILRSSIQENAGMAAIVNQAGRQRMLLHRTAINAERYVFAFEEQLRSQSRTELLSDTFKLEKSHYELMAPEDADRVGVADNLRAIYEDSPWLLDSEMRNYLLHVRSLVDAQPDDVTFENPHFAYIRNPETVDKIRDGLEAVVDVYETRGEAKTTQLNLFAIWSFASTLVLLLLDGWFVFRPMVHEVRIDVAELNDLNHTLEQRVSERTSEAELRAEQLAQSEVALRESEALYSSLVHHLPMSVLRKDRDGRLLFANDPFCKLVNRQLDEILGKTDADFYPPQLAKKYRADDDHVMETSGVFQDIEQHQTKDGRELFVEVLKVPLQNSEGDIIGTQTMFWDVTERKQAEERALQAERLAAIGQMVTGVAHESRNALQQIQACSQLLKWEVEGDEKKQELIADLQRAEERLLRTFEELRNYAAPLKLERKLCDVPEIVANAWASIAALRDAREVHFSENGNNVRGQCSADPFQLEQVFRNLFENSVSACDDPVWIEVTYEAIDHKGTSYLRIAIADNGPGLTPEQQSRIFEPFFTTKTQGTGLGMAIVKRIVDSHGGTIVAGPNGTKGAVMTVTLPCSNFR